MLKSIKKSFKYLIITAAIVLLLPTILFLILRTSFAQTFIARKVTAYISDEINATVSIGKVEFSFFNKLALYDILIKDYNNDTLLYAPKIAAGIRQFDNARGIIRLGKVVVMKPVVAFITDSTGRMNVTWYLDNLRKPKDTTNVRRSVFSINQIEVSDARFLLLNKFSAPSKIPFDYNNIQLTELNAIIENLNIDNDSTTFDIYGLGFREKNGFILKRMNCKLLLHQQNIVFRDLSLLCDSSTIVANKIGIWADSAGSFKRFIREVKFDISLRKSLINSSDLKYFVPFLHDYDESVWLSGNITGTVSELKGRNIMLSYRDETSLECKFDLSGLPDIKNTFIFIDVGNLRTNSNDIEQIKIPGKGYIILPEVLRKLGVVSFSGSFTGFITDFVTYGKISTKKGLISTDLSLRPEEDKRFRIKGLIKGSDIDLGSLSGNDKLFGSLTMAANVEGYTDSFKTFALKGTGNIDSVEINNYKYRNIKLNGNFANKAWDGNIKVEDKNLQMELMGMLDFRKALPEFDFTLNVKKADLFNLHIEKPDTSAGLSILLTANFKGNSIDNLDGEIKLLNSKFRKYSNNLELVDFDIRAFPENNIPSISLRTDFIDANLHGHYSFEGLRNVVKRTLSSFVPSKYNIHKETYGSSNNDFTFDIKFKNTDKLNKFLRTGIQLAENSDLQGSIAPDSIISFTGKTGLFAFNNNNFKDVTLDASIIDSVFSLNLKSSSFILSGVSDIKDIRLNLTANPDHFKVDLGWDNKDKMLNKGSLKAQGVFSRNAEKMGKTFIRIDLLPGEIYSRNNLWKVNPAEILIDTNSVHIEKFNISNNENYILIDGTISENSGDTLQMRFKGINIDPLNILYEKRMNYDPSMIHLSLEGILNGNVSFTNVYRNFLFESDIRISDFSILEGKYGDVIIRSVWNNSRKVAEITANNYFDNRRMFDVTGIYDPGTKKANLTARADKLPIDLLNPLLKSFASGITGTASGTVNLTGEFSKPVLTGTLWGENATLKVDYLQTKYRFSDSIRFDNAGIKFNNIQLFDERGKTATLNGAVYHKYFRNYSVDLTIRTNDCMVLNTKPKDNNMYYGTAYASGVTTIRTIGPVLSFDISAKTSKDTKFNIPLNTGLSVSANNFITYINPKKDTIVVKNPSTSAPSTLIEVAFDLEVTPDAEVKMIFDPKVGDEMKGTGSGNLNISYDRKGVYKMYGDYSIDDGEYLYTLGGIFNKRFTVQNGGKVTFNGDVEDAEIDIKAIYSTRASLWDIMKDQGMLPDAKLKERIPVECILNLSGRLFNPVVTFDINLPASNEETKAYLRSMIKSDEEMSRQFLFLLVMNSFYADPMTGTSQTTADISSATVGVTTTEMLSNQLSNWLSQINKNIDVGFNYRPGSTALPNSQDVQLALSTQFLNDKVTINGNFDYGSNQFTAGTSTGNNAITGAFNVEYKINEKIRFRVFNRSNDNFYIDNGIQYTQGIGIFYREEYNKLKDLFKRPVKSEMKKEKEPRVKKK